MLFRRFTRRLPSQATRPTTAVPPAIPAIVTVLPRSRSNPRERERRASMDDLALVRECLRAPEGDTRAFDEIVRRYEATVRANCRYLTRSEDDSWDLAQEVLIKAYHSLHRFEERSAFRTWLWRIKSNHCLNYLDRWRVRRGEQSVPFDDPKLRRHASPRPSPAELAERADTARQVHAVLDQMDDDARIPLVLRDLDGLSYPDIAEALDIGVSAAKMRVSRARTEFRERYRTRLAGSRAS